MDLRRPSWGWLRGCLFGVLACGGDAESVSKEMSADVMSSDETPESEGSGSQPPAGEVLPPAGEMPPPASQADMPLPVRPLRGAFAPLIEDVLSQPEEARPYLRYVLASRAAAALESEQEGLALLRLVNSSSLSAQLAAPVHLAALGVYRLDLRDYLWDRSVGLGPATFADAWEAIVDRSGLALPPLPDDPLAALTETSTAVLPARAFLSTVASGSMYYALTSAPGTEVELQEKLAARFPDPETERVYNAGFAGEVRHSYQGARRLLLPDGSAYWQGLPDTPRGNSIYADPLGFNSWETDAIYPLPNGLPAFFIDTPFSAPAPAPLTELRGRLQGSSDALVADCIACHAHGPLPMTDILVDYVRDNITQYDSETAELITNGQWATQAELDAIVAADSAAYERVLESAGLRIDSAEALQTITLSYGAGLEIADMAAALHATEAQVIAVLPFGTTTLHIDDFRSLFRGLLCQLHPEARAAADYCG